MATTPLVPAELRDALDNGRCSIFVGAGLSVAAGYPDWNNLLATLIREGERQTIIDKKKRKELEAMAKSPNKWLMVAQEISDSFGQGPFHSELVKIFKAIGAKPTEAHRAITEVPFRFVVTTNYDRLIENAYIPKFGEIPTIFTHADTSDFADALWREEFFILKAHGGLEKTSSIVLTEKDYRTVIYS